MHSNSSVEYDTNKNSIRQYTMSPGLSSGSRTARRRSCGLGRSVMAGVDDDAVVVVQACGCFEPPTFLALVHGRHVPRAPHIKAMGVLMARKRLFRVGHWNAPGWSTTSKPSLGSPVKGLVCIIGDN